VWAAADGARGRRARPAGRPRARGCPGRRVAAEELAAEEEQHHRQPEARQAPGREAAEHGRAVEGTAGARGGRDREQQAEREGDRLPDGEQQHGVAQPLAQQLRDRPVAVVADAEVAARQVDDVAHELGLERVRPWGAEAQRVQALDAVDHRPVEPEAGSHQRDRLLAQARILHAGACGVAGEDPEEEEVEHQHEAHRGERSAESAEETRAAQGSPRGALTGSTTASEVRSASSRPGPSVRQPRKRSRRKACTECG
jgi:hypothetical protein